MLAVTALAGATRSRQRPSTPCSLVCEETETYVDSHLQVSAPEQHASLTGIGRWYERALDCLVHASMTRKGSVRVTSKSCPDQHTWPNRPKRPESRPALTRVLSRVLSFPSSASESLALQGHSLSVFTAKCAFAIALASGEGIGVKYLFARSTVWRCRLGFLDDTVVPPHRAGMSMISSSSASSSPCRSMTYSSVFPWILQELASLKGQHRVV